MPGKALRILLLAAPLLGACAHWPKKPAPEPSAPKEIIAPVDRPARVLTTAQRPRPSATPARIRPSPPTRPAAPPAQATGGNDISIVTKPGASPAESVPLFRQAIVLANVRASVADLPNPPQAEFRQGLLTLKFRGQSPEQISTAVNRAMKVPEVTRVQAIASE